MKACSQQPVARGHALAAPRSCCAPASLAAYAMGATLWAPTLVLIAGQFGLVFGSFVPELPSVGPVRLFAVVWLLRFALYIVGAARRFDYGYGVNGVIVNRQWTLPRRRSASRATGSACCSPCMDRLHAGIVDRGDRALEFAATLSAHARARQAGIHVLFKPGSRRRGCRGTSAG